MITKKIVLVGIFSTLLIWIGYFTNRQSFNQLFGLYSTLFLIYFFLVNTIKNTREVLFVGIFFRLILLFSTPALSDDFYRFIWDGKLLLNGINPYLFTPEEFIQTTDFQNIFADKFTFNRLNSPQYYSVYPPLNQFIFAVAAFISNNKLWYHILALKLFILLAEIGTLIYLNYDRNLYSNRRMSWRENAALYAFNPLIIIELTGNLHFEAWIIFFLLLAFHFLIKPVKASSKSLIISAFLFGCAVSIKMFPLMLLPLVIHILGFKKGFYYAILVGIFTVLFFMPFIDKNILENIFSSVSLYFQKFEFNASIYYLLRAVGYYISGYNMIALFGKLLAIISFVSIIFIATKTKDIYLGTLSTFTIYFMLTTTVHPWYISILMAVSVFTNFRYAFAWSYMIFLSYSAYQSNIYEENFYLIFIEYLIVLAVIFYELKNKTTHFSGFSSLNKREL